MGAVELNNQVDVVYTYTIKIFDTINYAIFIRKFELIGVGK